MHPMSSKDPCVLNNCPNGDICRHIDNPDGSASRKCELPCESNPCANGGNCTKDEKDQRHCDCSHTGYGGDTCTVGK